MVALDTKQKSATPVRRARMLDPRLIPVVPPAVTTDPARQFHALLGLPPTNLAGSSPRRQGHGADLEALLASLTPARAKIIRQLLTGEDSRLKRALIAFIEDSRFVKLDFQSQRRALASFDLRWP